MIKYRSCMKGVVGIHDYDKYIKDRQFMSRQSFLPFTCWCARLVRSKVCSFVYPRVCSSSYIRSHITNAYQQYRSPDAS